MQLTFKITFHGPFHVGSGVPSQGIDRVLDRDALLPATSLKGAMRAAAAEQLGLPGALVDAVYGTKRTVAATRRTPSPWAWTDAQLKEPQIEYLTRIRINDETGLTERGFLMAGESVWSSEASFSVSLLVPVQEPERQLLVLRASARAITSIGGGRSRGEGWVTIQDETGWGLNDTKALLEVGK